ncbi:MAG: DUF1566 domain-containing protein [Nitrospirae bacterium]|nr:DUF1566 domain-containing protein [Nitrospirota bacterium]
MGYDVFISYNREDRGFADKLVSELENIGIGCWIDRGEIVAGLNWREEVSKTITENPKLLMVVLLSKETLQSKRVAEEVGLADDNDLYMIPVFIENVKLKGALALPLNSKHRIEAFNPDIDVANEICVAFKKQKSAPPIPPPTPKSTTPPSPPTRFVDNGDETITDRSTRLVWTKDANLAGRKNWQGALDYVASMNKGTVKNFGYTDWQLPTIQELYSLCRTDGTTTGLTGLNGILHSGKKGYCNGKKVDVASLLTEAGFTNVRSGYYWSSTSYAGSTSSAWFISMVGGRVYADVKSNNDYVWPVRSGH